MKIRYAREFAKQFDKADQKIKEAVNKRIALFQNDPFHPQLNNHQLKGKYSGYRSINITGDWRAHYKKIVDEEGEIVVVFTTLGTHSQLYK